MIEADTALQSFPENPSGPSYHSHGQHPGTQALSSFMEVLQLHLTLGCPTYVSLPVLGLLLHGRDLTDVHPGIAWGHP